MSPWIFLLAGNIVLLIACNVTEPTPSF